MSAHRFRAGDVTEYDIGEWTPLEIERLERIEAVGGEHLFWPDVAPLLEDRASLIDDARD